MITIACSSDIVEEAHALADRLREADADGDDVVVQAHANEQTSEREAVGMFCSAIACSVCLYVLAPNGVVGRLTAAEIGYARASRVPVYTSAPLIDDGLACLVSGTLSQDELVAYVASR